LPGTSRYLGAKLNLSPIRKPPRIRSGDVVGVIAPSGAVDEGRLEAGIKVLEGWGLRVEVGSAVLSREAYLAGSDAARLADLERMLDDDRVRAIFCARGGYGSQRIVPALELDRLHGDPKPIVGYSDVTALLLWLRRRAGLVGFHGPMLERGADADPRALEQLLAQLAGSAPLPLVLAGRTRIPGRGAGRLAGGSLTLVAASLATPWEIDTRGAILLFEEVNEAPYRIDRMLQQLRAAGKLAPLAGVGVGDVSSCVDERYGTDALAVIEEAVRPIGVPLVTELPFGHVRANSTWPMGVRAELNGDRGELRILEHGVRAPR
jgi:muramoyltetrapeptide carboxypeptidase